MTFYIPVHLDTVARSPSSSKGRLIGQSSKSQEKKNSAKVRAFYIVDVITCASAKEINCLSSLDFLVA